VGGAAGPAGARTFVRFDRVERWAHWANATLFGILIATAACLYVGPLAVLVGRRELVKGVHVYAGLLLPLPVLVAFCSGRRGRAFRRDVARLNRWLPDDWRWLRSRGRDTTVRLGKFNAGQKLNAAFTAAAIPVMLVTGSIMRWYSPFPLHWRTGATFVHDTLFLALVCTITGHIVIALRDPECVVGMRRGWVTAAWARRHSPRWLEELDALEAGEPEHGEQREERGGVGGTGA
jgi:formate dehydrogenase subunit gamma